jgi:hypothetical protein
VTAAPSQLDTALRAPADGNRRTILDRVRDPSPRGRRPRPGGADEPAGGVAPPARATGAIVAEFSMSIDIEARSRILGPTRPLLRPPQCRRATAAADSRGAERSHTRSNAAAGSSTTPLTWPHDSTHPVRRPRRQLGLRTGRTRRPTTASASLHVAIARYPVKDSVVTVTFQPSSTGSTLVEINQAGWSGALRRARSHYRPQR